MARKGSFVFPRQVTKWIRCGGGGSADYIPKNLLPPGKTRMVLWSGDTVPTEARSSP